MVAAADARLLMRTPLFSSFSARLAARLADAAPAAAEA
jgi:hypothetical protein